MFFASNTVMKLQLTREKTIEVRMPWEASGQGSSSQGGFQDVVGVALGGHDSRGCPAVRLRRKRGSIQVMAVGFVKPPAGALPNSWEENKVSAAWSLPVAFQAPYAALAISSKQMFVRQTTLDVINAAPVAAAGETQSPGRKKLGVHRASTEKKAEEDTRSKEDIKPFVPVSRDGMRFVTAPFAEETFVLQSGLPEFQVLWLSRLLPEGKRPTAGSIQTAPAAVLSSLFSQPAFVEADGTAAAMFVHQGMICFAGFRGGELVMYRECPGNVGSDVMRELVKSSLGVDENLVDSFLEDSLIDPTPALEPLMRPVLQQLRLSLDFLAQRHEVRPEKVFLMGLPSGATFWDMFAKETIGASFIFPSVFEGLDLMKGCGAEMKPAESQAFLAAYGAARAAMGGER